MRKITKVPTGSKAIAEMMNMHEAEIREWPYIKEVQSVLRDYNLKAVSKDNMLSKLAGISLQCKKDETLHYSTGIDNLVCVLRYVY